MAQFTSVVLTAQGADLMAKILGGYQMSFTAVKTSSDTFSYENLPNLSNIGNIKQSAIPVKITKTGTAQIKLSVLFNNTDLTEGYYIQTVGIYANDPNLGEILYAVAISQGTADYFPSAATVSQASCNFNLTVTT